jgi:glycosyltransferase involved in cell wall biosynthesis
MPAILIYRDQLIHGSETFIPVQAENLPTYEPYYAGMKRIDSDLSISEDRSQVVNPGGWLGRLKEMVIQFTRFPPSYLQSIKRWNPSLVHAHFGPDAVNGLRVAKWLGVPLVVTYHGYDVTVRDEYARKSFYRHRAYLRHRKRIKQEVDGFIAVSDFIKRRLIEEGFPEDRIFRHYIGIDLDDFCPSDDVEREDVILFVGRLVDKKGGEYLIRAGAQVQETHPEIEVVLVGDGPLRDDLEQLAEEVGCTARFLGQLPSEQVQHWMNRARVFCVPSITAESGDMEAFGMVFAEAQAMGLPVASFESGGIPEVVLHGETGLLAQEKDWKQLAENINCLLDNTELWGAFSQRGQRHVREHFDVKDQSVKLESIYEEVLRRS